ncbi:NAD(+)--rifampin ADP-ribosyltransferase [Corynebacterium sp. AOP40-9SA-29]|uniref:NAD(+)--rifampin ADP-ribosyltransferase n=1 Tax=Corynebacterium sp. AOP40-9SA-29 TaxID=3457677 RepID=UPI00403351E9
MEHNAETGPFFHGTRAEFAVGDRVCPGHRSNYRPEIVMNHVYFTALSDGAALAAEIAAMLAGEDAQPHVYRVEPTGTVEDDPNVTDKKFPGNPTRSYRTDAPLVVVEEVHDWPRLSPQDLEAWRGRLTALRDGDAEIIN